MSSRFARYFPSTSDRVSMHTPDHVNDRILAEMEERISRYVNDRGAIAARLREIGYEWDTERALEAVFSGVALSSFVLGTTTNRRWFWLAGLGGAVLLQHTLQGWCPPAALLRRLGFRTAREIESERVALKALRGDFDQAEDEVVSARHLLMSADPTFYH